MSREYTPEELIEQGETAADFIEGLLDIADLDGDIDIEVKNDRVYLSIVGGGEDLDHLSGNVTVEALQELTRLAVQSNTGEYSKLVLDIGGSREAREQELRSLVSHAIAQIEAGRERIKLESMTSYERKIVHDETAARGYHSESEGIGKDRRLVITRPKQ